MSPLPRRIFPSPPTCRVLIILTFDNGARNFRYRPRLFPKMKLLNVINVTVFGRVTEKYQQHIGDYDRGVSRDGHGWRQRGGARRRRIPNIRTPTTLSE